MLYKFVHGEPITDIKVGRYSCESTKALLAKGDANVLYGSKIMGIEDADQKETDDAQSFTHSVYNHEDVHDSKTSISSEGKKLDGTILCCEEEERLVPPVPSLFLPDKVSLFTENNLNCEYSSTVNNEAIAVNSYFNINNTAVVPTSFVPSEELTRTNSSHTATVIPAVITSNYGSKHLSASSIPLPGSTDLHVLHTDSKDPSKNLSNPYMHFMEHERKDVEPPQQCQQSPWQHQKPSHHQQPPQQYQQLSLQPQYLHAIQQYQQLPQSQQFLQEQGYHEPRKDEDVFIVSPYFPNFHDPQVDARQSIAPQQYHHLNLPQPSTFTSDHHCLPLTSPTQFMPRTWSETFRPSTSVHPNNNVNSSVALENTQRQQKYLSCQQQLCSNKIFGTAKPH